MGNTGVAKMHKGLGMMLALLALLLMVQPADAAPKRKQAAQLEQMQAAYASAVRWGEFEQAWQLVDPAYREANPMTELAFERYQQIQISGYSDRNTSVADNGDVIRNIELRVINRHTMAERTMRYTERWRYDAAKKAWSIEGGLPDFWAGE